MRTWIADDPHKYRGTVVANGHCARHVQMATGITHSSTWRRGVSVRDADADELLRGVVIATFDKAGHYANATDGSSHICILLERKTDGLLVVDQWVGKPVGERLIRWKGGAGKAVDDADQYFVVQTDDGIAATA